MLLVLYFFLKNSSISSGSSKDVGSGKEIQVFDIQHEENRADSKHIDIKVMSGS